MTRVWRLRPRGEFERVRQQGKSWPHRYFVLIVQARTNGSDDPPRIGVVAGRRLGAAVLRNRIKRQIRAAVLQIYPGLTNGVDLIIIARAPIAAAGVANIASALKETLQQAQAWTDEP